MAKPFDYRIDHGNRMKRKVTAWKRGFKDFRWLWPAATREVARVHNELFRTEGKSGGVEWMPLAEATKRFRERKVGYYGRHHGMAGTEGPILHWTFRLRDSLSDFHDQGTMFSIRRFQKKMIFGSSHPLAKLNHYGIDAPARYMLDEQNSLEAVKRVANKVLFKQMNSRTGEFRKLR